MGAPKLTVICSPYVAIDQIFRQMNLYAPGLWVADDQIFGQMNLSAPDPVIVWATSGTYSSCDLCLSFNSFSNGIHSVLINGNILHRYIHNKDYTFFIITSTNEKFKKPTRSGFWCDFAGSWSFSVFFMVLVWFHQY